MKLDCHSCIRESLSGGRGSAWDRPGHMRVNCLIYLVVMLALAAGCKPDKADVDDMFRRAGGVEVVNQEAERLFQRFGTNDSRVIQGLKLTNYPKLSSIGRPLFLQMSTSNTSSHIDLAETMICPA
jgi:hypothetical protein